MIGLLRVAPTVRVVVDGHAIELACGAGSARRTCRLGSPAIVEWLLSARQPRPRQALERSAAAALGVDAATAAALIDQLVANGALIADDGRDPARRVWDRAALAIHEATRDLAFESSAEAEANQERWAAAQRAAEAAGDDEPSPPALVEYAGDRVDLGGHRHRFEADLAPASSGPLPFDRLAALVDLALGATGTFEWRPWGTHIRRTSPSLGARHAVGGFVIARDVDGLAPGPYRVDPDGPALIASARSAPAITGRAALVLTCRWPRMIWKYRDPRYYSMALLDAGHVLSTARLGARHLGLAVDVTVEPDGTLAADLGLDPLDEGPLALVELA